MSFSTGSDPSSDLRTELPCLHWGEVCEVISVPSAMFEDAASTLIPDVCFGKPLTSGYRPEARSDTDQQRIAAFVAPQSRHLDCTETIGLQSQKKKTLSVAYGK